MNGWGAMRPRRGRPVPVAAATVTAALAAVACTGSPSNPARMVTPPPLRFTVDGSPPAGATPVRVSDLLRRAWTITAAAHTAVLTDRTRTRLTAAGQPPQLFGVTTTGPAGLDRAAVDLTVVFPRHVTQQWRFIGDALYTPDTLTSADVTPATTWTRTDLADPTNYTQSDPVPPNPVSLLRDLSMSLTNAAATATTRIDGTPVTRYDATAQLPAAIAAATSAGARLTLRHLKRTLPTDHLYVQEWIDGRCRIRQLTYTDQNVSPTSAGKASDPQALATTSTTLTLSRFGLTAPLTAPTVTPAHR